MKQHGVSRLGTGQAAADSLSSAENEMEELMDLNSVCDALAFKPLYSSVGACDFRYS